MEFSGIDAVEITESGDGDYGCTPFASCDVTSIACSALVDGRIQIPPQTTESPK